MFFLSLRSGEMSFHNNLVARCNFENCWRETALDTDPMRVAKPGGIFCGLEVPELALTLGACSMLASYKTNGTWGALLQY